MLRRGQLLATHIHPHQFVWITAQFFFVWSAFFELLMVLRQERVLAVPPPLLRRQDHGQPCGLDPPSNVACHEPTRISLHLHLGECCEH